MGSLARDVYEVQNPLCALLCSGVSASVIETVVKTPLDLRFILLF